VSEQGRTSLVRGLRHTAGALLCLLLVLQVSPGAAGPQQTEEDLKRARNRARELTQELQEARSDAADLQAQIVLLTQRIAILTAEAETLEAAIQQVREEKRQATAEINGLQQDLDDRARSTYIDGPGSALELVLEAESLTELSDRLGFLQILQREDSDLSLGIQVERDQLTEFVANLQEYKKEKKDLLAELTPQQEELDAALAAQLALADQIAQDRAEAKDLAERLSKKLQAQLAAAAQAAAVSTGGGPPLKADGPLYHCPVDSPRSYVDTFGAPRVGHTHQGNDIFAATGTPIRAPFEGTAQEGFDGLGGIVVHVYSSNGSGDYVYNAHLSKHAGVDGDHVTPGELIGYVGNTGNAVGTSPHDHFEYHPGGGSAVSPYPYLNEVCGVNGAGF
jgi:murein DD-endopeptidase MepM/ murein hydrolase activator NlpD